MARLAAVEAQRAEDEQALDEERERVRDAREEARVLKLKMEDQQQRLEELEAGLAAKRWGARAGGWADGPVLASGEGGGGGGGGPLSLLSGA